MSARQCSSAFIFKNRLNFHSIQSILLHDFSLLCSLILSYPLYFSPYFIRFLSFVSPLCLTTALLLLLLLSAADLPPPKLGFLHVVIHGVQSERDDDDGLCDFEDFQILKFVFDGALPPVAAWLDRRSDSPVEETEEEKPDGVEDVTTETETDQIRLSSNGVVGDLCVSVEKIRGSASAAAVMDSDNETIRNSGELDVVNGAKSSSVMNSNNKMIRNSTELDVVNGDKSSSVMNSDDEIILNSAELDAVNGAISSSATNSNDKILGNSGEPDAMNDAKSSSVMNPNNKTIRNSDEQEKSGPVMNPNNKTVRNSEEQDVVNAKSSPVINPNNKPIENPGKPDAAKGSKSSSWRVNSSNNLRSHGSTSKEMEWKNTLACKLFKERHNAGGGGDEGMDSLWEAYDHSENQNEIAHKNADTILIKNRSSKHLDYGANNEDDEEEEAMFSTGHLCCLQALKFSSGKMIIGMKRSNLVKISKALKGFGWLHHVSSKHGKKRVGFR